MTILWIYTFTQLYTTTFALYNKAKCKRAIDKIIKERGYEYIKKDYIDRAREYSLYIIKCFVPLFCGFESSKLLEEVLTATPEDIIKKRVKDGEIKQRENQTNPFELRNRLLEKDKMEQPYKAGPNKLTFIDGETPDLIFDIDDKNEKPDLIFDPMLVDDQKYYEGIGPCAELRSFKLGKPVDEKLTSVENIENTTKAILKLPPKEVKKYAEALLESLVSSNGHEKSTVLQYTKKPDYKSDSVDEEAA